MVYFNDDRQTHFVLERDGVTVEAWFEPGLDASQRFHLEQQVNCEHYKRIGGVRRQVWVPLEADVKEFCKSQDLVKLKMKSYKTPGIDSTNRAA